MREDFKKYARDYNVSSTLFDGYVENSMTPYIIEERQLNVAQMDVFSRLMKDRIIFLGTGVNSQVANIIQAQLLYLDSCGSEDINIYINSPGGSVYDGLGILDVMNLVNSNVNTTVTAMAASMGAVLLSAGKNRKALKHSRTMIHQPSSGTQGTISDMEISLREGIKLKDELYQILSENCNQPYDKIVKDSERDFWLTAEEAKEYGIIDEII